MAGAYQQRGVSLIEIVIAFAVTAVFVAFTLPGANIGPGRARMADTGEPDLSIAGRFQPGDPGSLAAYNLEAGDLYLFPSYPETRAPEWSAQPSFTGIMVACQATARHSPLRFTNVPVLKYSMTPGGSACTLPTRRNATTAVLP